MTRGTTIALAGAVAVAVATTLQAADAPDAELRLAPNELPQHIIKVLRTSNKAQTNRYLPKVYDVKNVNPYAVVRFIRRVMQIEEGAWFMFANPEGNAGKILVVCPEYQHAGLDELVSYLDVPKMTSSAGASDIIYKLKHRDAFDVGFQNNVLLSGTPTADYIPDDQNNLVYIKDTPSGTTRMLQEVADHLDLPTPQLEAMATVYEIDLTDDGRIGLDYISWKNGPGRNLFSIGSFGQIDNVGGGTTGNGEGLLYDFGQDTFGLPGGQDWQSGGLNYAYFYDVPSAYFDFLVTKGEARIVTQSKLVALNLATAVLEIGEEILYYQVKAENDLRAGSRPVALDPYGDYNPAVEDDGTLVDFPDNRVVVPTTTERALGAASSGFFLQMTPTINRIGANVEFIMSIVNHTGYSDDGTPVLASRSVDTTFKIPHDGRELTVGSLVRKRRVDGANKIPVLGDIPGLGNLFGGESRLDQKTLVLVTIAARVVKFGESNLTDEDRATEERVEGTRDTKTNNNKPGFLRK